VNWKTVHIRQHIYILKNALNENSVIVARNAMDMNNNKTLNVRNQILI
jgi:hypothetical protein